MTSGGAASGARSRRSAAPLVALLAVLGPAYAVTAFDLANVLLGGRMLFVSQTDAGWNAWAIVLGVAFVPASFSLARRPRQSLASAWVERTGGRHTGRDGRLLSVPD